MTQIRIPTPLRPYAGGEKDIEVSGQTVGAVLEDLVARHPDLRSHLFNGDGALRPYVVVFVNDRDSRELGGSATPVSEGDRLVIVPSIAGGADGLRSVDHAAIRANQAVIIGMLAGAFVADGPVVVGIVAAGMAFGSLRGIPGFRAVYRGLRRLGVVHPDILQDHPEPHRFAQTVGAVFLLVAIAGFALGLPAFGWLLAAVVAGLAALNLFGGVCVGCAAYYWLARSGLRGFSKTPPPGTRPGRRPAA